MVTLIKVTLKKVTLGVGDRYSKGGMLQGGAGWEEMTEFWVAIRQVEIHIHLTVIGLYGI